MALKKGLIRVFYQSCQIVRLSTYRIAFLYPHLESHGFLFKILIQMRFLSTDKAIWIWVLSHFDPDMWPLFKICPTEKWKELSMFKGEFELRAYKQQFEKFTWKYFELRLHLKFYSGLCGILIYLWSAVCGVQIINNVIFPRWGWYL